MWMFQSLKTCEFSLVKVCCHCRVILYENCVEHHVKNKQVNVRPIINYQPLHCSFLAFAVTNAVK
jgi:hypothetical protein